jgi:hypothetical protein
MGGSPTDSNANNSAPLRFGGGGATPVQSQSTQPWQVQSSHPEANAQGLSSGITNGLSIGLGMGQAKGGSQQPNSTGGYDSQQQVQTAAPHAAGYTYVEGTGWVPQAQGVNYQPDQMQRLYGYNYGNM